MPAEEDRGENYLDIHSVGQRTSKYMEYQLNTAPLLNRNATQVTREFNPKPLGDCNVNRMLAQNFKQGVASAPKGLDVTLDGLTLHEAEYPKRSNEDLLRARQQAASTGAGVFARTKTLGGSGYLMEKQSHMHMKFITPDLTVAKPMKVVLPRQCMDLGGNPREVRTRSSLQQSFPPGSGLAAATAVQSLSRSASTPELSRVLSSMARPDPMDPAVMATKRAPFMGPGQ